MNDYNYYEVPNKAKPKLQKENGSFGSLDINNPKSGGGFTSIRGRVERGMDAKYKLKKPLKPDCMNNETYKKIIEYEFRTGDGGINIHAGHTAAIHSLGCFILGTEIEGVGFNYQKSIEADFLFKTAIYCANEIGKKKIILNVTDTKIEKDNFNPSDLGFIIKNINIYD